MSDRVEAIHSAHRFSIADTISPEAAADLATAYAAYRQRPPLVKPSSLADWDREYARIEAIAEPVARRLAGSLGVTTRTDQIGGVPVLRIRAPRFMPGRNTLFYIHGGRYVLLSARSSLIVPALLAAASGCEVISIDYTVAPRGDWRTAPDQILNVWQAVIANRTRPASCGVIGDSAGGGLAAGSVLKMRDHGLPMPGAIYLISPWSDVTAAGDTYETLAGNDPSLDLASLSWSANAYAAPPNQRHPYISPVYGDYTKGFPPTLIQGGTREMFLSNFVRQYQAIRGGGNHVVLDLYEGMPHVFQALVPRSPETQISIDHAVQFLAAHLD
jgi:monoterpene epsilon-lactone hydrolase